MAEPSPDRGTVSAAEHVLLQRSFAALEDQFRAANEVIAAIGRSGGDADTVLATIVQSARRLCRSQASHLYLLEDGVYRLIKAVGVSEETIALIAEHPMPVDSKTLIGRVGLDRRTQQIADVLADPDYGRHDLQRVAGFRTTMGAPMLLDDRVVGALIVWRNDVSPFDDREMAIVSAFAGHCCVERSADGGAGHFPAIAGSRLADENRLVALATSPWPFLGRQAAPHRRISGGSTIRSLNATVPAQTRGYILTRFADTYGRAVAMVYPGGRRGRAADGGSIYLDVPELRRSVNWQLLDAGWVYPTFYSKLYVDLREDLAATAAAARDAGKGVWADDSTLPGFTLRSRTQLSDELVILPKLFRRLAEYVSLDETGKVSLAGFPAFLAAHDDRLFTVPSGQATSLDTLVQSRGQTLHLILPPEQIVFQEN